MGRIVGTSTAVDAQKEGGVVARARRPDIPDELRQGENEYHRAVKAGTVDARHRAAHAEYQKFRSQGEQRFITKGVPDPEYAFTRSEIEAARA